MHKCCKLSQTVGWLRSDYHQRTGSVPAAERFTAREGDGHLQWRHIEVRGRTVQYGVAGKGLPILFLHGWALGQHSYKRPLKRLVQLGCRVYAPALPGFGGSDDLPADQVSMAGYAAAVAEFVEAVGLDEPVLAVGHSFGGGVAIQLAHDFPGVVGSLVVINSVGGPTWLQAGSRARTLAERPWWDWGMHFPLELFPLSDLGRLASVMAEDAVPNAIRNPLALWRAGQLARTADLTAELVDLQASGMPIVAVRGDQDTVIPRASFDALCEALGLPGEVVPGRHSWLLADPDAFGEVMARSVTAAINARQAGGDWAANLRRHQERAAGWGVGYEAHPPADLLAGA